MILEADCIRNAASLRAVSKIAGDFFGRLTISFRLMDL